MNNCEKSIQNCLPMDGKTSPEFHSIHQKTDAFLLSKGMIDAALEDKKLELQEFQKNMLGNLHADVMLHYKEEISQYPGGITALQKSLSKKYPTDNIHSDGIF